MILGYIWTLLFEIFCGFSMNKMEHLIVALNVILLAFYGKVVTLLSHIFFSKMIC
jgi:hypothetical protein